MIELSTEQQECHDFVIEWTDRYLSGNKVSDHIVMSGLAGTGKTTLLGFIAKTIKEKFNVSIAFCTYTGKASVVLKSKLHEDFDDGFNHIGTIHSLIYKPIIDPITKKILDWHLSNNIDQQVIIIDEASMVSLEIWKDLMTFNVPIICIGDHGQLPPISKSTFSLMKNPDITIEQIHRQAAENPIIKLSMIARSNGNITEGIYGKEAAKLSWSHPSAKKAINSITLTDDKQILCGMNKTRAQINKRIRAQLGFNTPVPCVGEKIICLKNNKKLNIMNGQMGTIKSVTDFSKHLFEMCLQMDGVDYDIYTLVAKSTFGVVKYTEDIYNTVDPVIRTEAKSSVYTGNKINFFDFGYAISVHKSQGSEWNNVILIEEYNNYQSEDDMIKWLYTGITRAAKKLLIIYDYY